MAKKNKLIAQWQKDKEIIPADVETVFEKTSASWAPAKKKAMLRQIANNPLRAYGIKSWDETTPKMRAEIRKARGWYLKTDKKARINEREGVQFELKPTGPGVIKTTLGSGGRPDMTPPNNPPGTPSSSAPRSPLPLDFVSGKGLPKKAIPGKVGKVEKKKVLSSGPPQIGPDNASATPRGATGKTQDMSDVAKTVASWFGTARSTQTPEPSTSVARTGRKRDMPEMRETLSKTADWLSQEHKVSTSKPKVKPAKLPKKPPKKYKGGGL